MLGKDIVIPSDKMELGFRKSMHPGHEDIPFGIESAMKQSGTGIPSMRKWEAFPRCRSARSKAFCLGQYTAR
jgi:hypothetical protein